MTNPFLWYCGTDEECMRLLHTKPMTKDEALAEAIGQEGYEPGDFFYLVEANKMLVGKFHADLIFEAWMDQNEDRWGEEFPGVSDEAVASLQAALDTWFDDNQKLLPDAWAFGTIRERHEIIVPEVGA